MQGKCDSNESAKMFVSNASTYPCSFGILLIFIWCLHPWTWCSRLILIPIYDGITKVISSPLEIMHYNLLSHLHLNVKLNFTLFFECYIIVSLLMVLIRLVLYFVCCVLIDGLHVSKFGRCNFCFVHCMLIDGLFPIWSINFCACYFKVCVFINFLTCKKNAKNINC